MDRRLALEAVADALNLKKLFTRGTRGQGQGLYHGETPVIDLGNPNANLGNWMSDNPNVSDSYIPQRGVVSSLYELLEEVPTIDAQGANWLDFFLDDRQRKLASSEFSDLYSDPQIPGILIKDIVDPGPNLLNWPNDRNFLGSNLLVKDPRIVRNVYGTP